MASAAGVSSAGVAGAHHWQEGEWSTWQCWPMHSLANQTSDRLGLQPTEILDDSTGKSTYLLLHSLAVGGPVLPFQYVGQREINTMFCSQTCIHVNFNDYHYCRFCRHLLVTTCLICVSFVRWIPKKFPHVMSPPILHPLSLIAPGPDQTWCAVDV